MEKSWKFRVALALNHLCISCSIGPISCKHFSRKVWFVEQYSKDITEAKEHQMGLVMTSQKAIQHIKPKAATQIENIPIFIPHD